MRFEIYVKKIVSLMNNKDAKALIMAAQTGNKKRKTIVKKRRH